MLAEVVLRKERRGMAGRGDGSNASSGFVVEKWLYGGGPQQESWSPQPLTAWGKRKEVGEVPGKSLDGIIFNDPLTFPR
jgi:hypothetical protein